MTDEQIPADAEAAMEAVLQELFKAMPLKEFIDSQCPLRFKHWLRRLEQHPEVLADFRPLVIDEAGEQRYRLRPDQLDRLMNCVERHPVLKTMVDREWRHFHAHNLRAILFRELPAPKVKSKEWKKLYAKLETILARAGKNDHLGEGDYYLVMDEVEEPGHKIEVQNPECITPRLIEEIQGALQGWKNVWYVLMQLDVDSLHLDADPFCLVVWSDHVDDMGDRKRLRELLGSRFKL